MLGMSSLMCFKRLYEEVASTSGTVQILVIMDCIPTESHKSSLF